MASINWFEFIFEIFFRISDLANALYNFLFYEISLLGVTASLWAVLGGTAVTIILSARIVKLVVPFL